MPLDFQRRRRVVLLLSCAELSKRVLARTCLGGSINGFSFLIGLVRFRFLSCSFVLETVEEVCRSDGIFGRDILGGFCTKVLDVRTTLFCRVAFQYFPAARVAKSTVWCEMYIFL